jgi:shikimate dehydrogenase
MTSFSGNLENEKNFYILGDERVYHTKAPEIFSAIMATAGIKGSYEPYAVTPGKIEEAIRDLKALNFTGANVTIPYKESIIPYLDELSEGATIIGSVNTIVRSGDKLKGYNTNAIGFMDALKTAGFETKGKSVLVFGTGGAARAVVFILNWMQAAPIIVAGRNQDKVSAVINKIAGESQLINALTDGPLPVDLVVNATSVSCPDEDPDLAQRINHLQLPHCRLVVDLNYGRSPNFWQNTALKKAVPFMDGFTSLTNQARRTFALWTGILLEPEVVMAAIQKYADR